MGRNRRLFSAVALAAGIVVGASALPAGAIVFGAADGDDHPNVAAIVATDQDGVSFPWCTGTLISPTVVVTAAHCFDGFPGLEFSVTFASDLDPDGDGDMDEIALLSGEPTMHEGYRTTRKSNTYDIAVFVLDEAVHDIVPADLPELGAFDDRAVRSERFTAVGYGAVRQDKATGPHALSDASVRGVATQSLLTVTGSWATFSMNPSTGNGGTCYGDSGGPHFLGAGDTETNIVMSLTVSGDFNCRATDKTYRLDTGDAQDFLARFLP